SNRDGDVDVYTRAADGSDVVQVTNHDSTDSHPWYSPDGQSIAWYSNRDGNYEIYASINGADAVRLTNHPDTDQFPSYSPDGTQLVFASYRDGDGDLFLMNADGSGVHRILVHEGEDLAPAWSPDGEWITFVTRRPPDQGSDMDIYVVRPDGTGLTNLTNDLEHSDSNPRWLPGS
ncbi:MAG: Tol biopolymer transport system component, partial [Thalassolituus oleivorans]